MSTHDSREGAVGCRRLQLRGCPRGVRVGAVPGGLGRRCGKEKPQVTVGNGQERGGKGRDNGIPDGRAPGRSSERHLPHLRHRPVLRRAGGTVRGSSSARTASTPSSSSSSTPQTGEPPLEDAPLLPPHPRCSREHHPRPSPAPARTPPGAPSPPTHPRSSSRGSGGSGGRLRGEIELYPHPEAAGPLRSLPGAELGGGSGWTQGRGLGSGGSRLNRPWDRARWDKRGGKALGSDVAVTRPRVTSRRI